MTGEQNHRKHHNRQNITHESRGSIESTQPSPREIHTAQGSAPSLSLFSLSLFLFDVSLYEAGGFSNKRKIEFSICCNGCKVYLRALTLMKKKREREREPLSKRDRERERVARQRMGNIAGLVLSPFVRGLLAFLTGFSKPSRFAWATSIFTEIDQIDSAVPEKKHKRNREGCTRGISSHPCNGSELFHFALMTCL